MCLMETILCHYKESDSVSPIGVYGKTKRKENWRVINANIDSIVIRTSWLYSSLMEIIL